jgi:hypothetical protein
MMSVSIVLGFMIAPAKLHFFSQMFFFLEKKVRKTKGKD